MSDPILYIDRQTGQLKEEKVYGGAILAFLYGSRSGRFLASLIAFFPPISKFYGWWQSLPITKRKVLPFIENFHLDVSEFETPPERFDSFNAFFIRKLKPASRPLAEGVILPADGRYLFYQNAHDCEGFFVKGKKFTLATLLKDEKLAQTYQFGTLILARLCPTDYHRFHFPCDCTPSAPRLINGPLYSVNPIALKQNIEILAENKRKITQLKTDFYGTILFIEVGATNVGSIHQTYTPNHRYKKGDEKGFFSFGGSSIILLFESDRIKIDQTLLINSSQHIETLCLFGQSLESKI